MALSTTLSVLSTLEHVLTGEVDVCRMQAVEVIVTESGLSSWNGLSSCCCRCRKPPKLCVLLVRVDSLSTSATEQTEKVSPVIEATIDTVTFRGKMYPFLQARLEPARIGFTVHMFVGASSIRGGIQLAVHMFVLHMVRVMMVVAMVKVMIHMVVTARVVP